MQFSVYLSVNTYIMCTRARNLCTCIHAFLTEVCHNVQTEPELQPLTGEHFEKTYLDIRVFNPHASYPTNRSTCISSCYRKHEAEKKRAYEQRIIGVEHSTFTPLVFSATGEMARQSTTFYKWLAALLADKWDYPYNSTLCWLRCSISFSLLRSAIQCIHGTRSSRGHPIKLSPPLDLVHKEAHICPT